MVAHPDYMGNAPTLPQFGWIGQRPAVAFRNVGADPGVCPYALRKSVPAQPPIRIAPAAVFKKGRHGSLPLRAAVTWMHRKCAGQYEFEYVAMVMLVHSCSFCGPT